MHCKSHAFYFGLRHSYIGFQRHGHRGPAHLQLHRPLNWVSAVTGEGRSGVEIAEATDNCKREKNETPNRRQSNCVQSPSIERALLDFGMDVDLAEDSMLVAANDGIQNVEQHSSADRAASAVSGSRKRRKQFDHTRPGTCTKFLCIDEESMEEYNKGKEIFRAKRRSEAESMIW